VGVSLSPLAIIAVILMLGTPRGRVTGISFVAAWALGLAVLGTLVLLIADEAGASEGGTPSDWVGILQIALGVLLLAVGARQWNGRPSDRADPELPPWMQSVETFTPMKSATMAVLFSSVKPKNLLLTIGAATAIAETGASTDRQVTALAVFVLLGTLGPGIPVAIYLLMRDRAPHILDGMRAWMVRENSTVIMVLCLAIAAKLIGDAVGTLAS
jgi:Sap, sulfolipid-1-addressing protein